MHRCTARLLAAATGLAFALSGRATPATAAPASPAPPARAFAGTWQLDAARSSEVPAWRQMELAIAFDGDAIVITRNLGWGRRQYADTISVAPGGGTAIQPLPWWPDNRHLGIYAAGDGRRRITAETIDEGRTVRTETTFTVETQQSTAPMRITTEYRLWPDEDRLTLIETRSSRQAPITYHFTRKP